MGDSSRLAMDLVALAELAGELARFAGGSVFAEAQVANQALNTHAPFGVASASGVVVEARSRYTRNMVRLVGSVHEYAREAAGLSMLLGQVVAAHQGSDAQAGLDVAVAGRASAGGGGSAGALFMGPVVPVAPGAQQVVSAPSPQHVAVAEARVRSGWCTNWSAYHAPSLWQMVEPDNVCAGATQEVAWRRVADSLTNQVQELQRRQVALTQAWSSPQAAEAMVLRLDRLIADMRQSAVAAAETCAALGRVNNAVAGAQQDLKKIADDYAGASNDLTLRSLDGAEDELNEKARVRMAAMELQVQDAVKHLPEAPEFVSPGRSDPSGNPPRPVEHPGDGGVLARRRPPQSLPGVDPVLPSGQEWAPAARPDQGLQLSGVSGPSAVAAGAVPGVIGHVPNVPAGPGGVPGLIGAVPRVPLGGSPLRAVPGVIGAVPRVPSGGSVGSGGVGGRVLSPGAVPGVIGGTPPGAGARPGTAGAGVGGGGAGSGAAGMIPAGATGGRGRAGSDGAGGVEPGHGEVVWEVPQGVSPTIEAGGDPVRPDPGPGVIGIDR